MLLGFDIGGTKCAVILGETGSNETINIIAKEVLVTSLPVFEMIELLFATAEAIIKKHSVHNSHLDGIGIACGGPLNSKTGVILSPPNLPGWDNIPIVELTEKRFGVKAMLQNDANACAVAEWKYGAAKGLEHIIFLTFGTGMGAGLILNGSLYSGTTDAAGEVGHIRMAETGPVGFGKAGSFEGFCSGGGIAQLAQAKARDTLHRGGQTLYCNNVNELNLITAKTVAEAAFNGDATAIEVYKTCGQYLGRGLSVLIDILNPEMIIIGGIYGRAKSLIEPWMNELIRKETLPISASACKVVSAALGEGIGDYAALALAGIVN
jgi:glucokinase